MWQLDVAPSPFLPHGVTHFLPRFPFFLTLSSTSFCSLGGGAWIFWFSRIACSWTSPSMPLVFCCRQPGFGSPGRFWNAACLLQAMGAKCDGPLERSTWWPMNLGTLRPKAK